MFYSPKYRILTCVNELQRCVYRILKYTSPRAGIDSKIRVLYVWIFIIYYLENNQAKYGIPYSDELSNFQSSLS